MSNGRLRVLMFLAMTAGLTYAFWPHRRPVEKKPPAPALLQVPATGPTAAGSLTSIRVLLTPAPTEGVDIQIDGPYRIQPVGNPRVLTDAPRLEATRLTVTKTGFQIGPNHIPATRLEIQPERSPSIWINGHQYRGHVRLYRRPGSRLLAVNVLPLEEYIASVVDSEMPAAFPVEARKAQAVVARTYALYQMGQAPRDALYDVYANTRSQKYLGYQYRGSADRLLAGESAASRQIVDETRGMACTYAGRLFCTYYSAVCGGHTLLGTELFDDAVPAIASVPCDYCRDAKYYRWDVSVSPNQLGQKLTSVVGNGAASWGRLLSLSPNPPPSPGRLTEFDVQYQQGHARVRSDRLRTALSSEGVMSPNFVVERRNDFLIHGRGHGHGAGLCQWGARGQAEQGRNVRQILAYYYPGSKIVILTAAVARNGR